MFRLVSVDILVLEKSLSNSSPDKYSECF